MFVFGAKARKEADQIKKKATAQVKKWVLEELTSALEGCDTSKIRIDVSEAACGDPMCSPVDTVIRLWFAETTEVLGIPLEVQEVLLEDVKDVMPPGYVLKDWFEGKEHAWPEPPNPSGTDTSVPLRFQVGDKVQCCVGPKEWTEGTVVKHWYRQQNFPPGMFAPYQIKLDTGVLIFAPYDTDGCVRAAS